MKDMCYSNKRYICGCVVDPSLCGTHNGTFLCTDGTCIFETWLCDKTKDCPDGADEQNCQGTY